MSCTPPVRTVTVAVDVPVWSKGGNNPSAPFVLSGDTPLQISPMLAQLRATVKVENATPGVSLKIGFQATDDGIQWGTMKDLTNNNPITQDDTVTTPWYNNVDDFLRALRIVADMGTTTNVEMARITVIIDFQLKS